MINMECENFHSRETLSKTLSNKTAGILVPIHAELQKISFQFSQNFAVLLLWTENLNYLFQWFSSSSVSASEETLHTTAQSA